MRHVFIAWAVAAGAMLVAMAAAGKISNGSYLGILTDGRGRYSLSRLQIVLWTLAVFSLLTGVVVGRLADATGNPLDVRVPDTVLLVLGISVGSTVTARVVKAGKDTRQQTKVAASDRRDPARFGQMVLAEEGKMADKAVDVTKFQSLWITLILVTGYVAMAVVQIGRAGSASELTSLPELTGGLAALLAISHAGYLAGKLPDRAGIPDGTLMLDLTNPERAEALRKEGKLKAFTPRNKPANDLPAEPVVDPIAPAPVGP